MAPSPQNPHYKKHFFGSAALSGFKIKEYENTYISNEHSGQKFQKLGRSSVLAPY